MTKSGARIPRIAFLLTGRLGHRNSNQESVAKLVNVLREIPGSWIGLALSSPVERVDSQELAKIVDRISLVDFSKQVEGLPSPMASVQWQCGQVSSLVEFVPKPVDVAVRLRIDWGVSSSSLLLEAVAGFQRSNKTLGSLALNVPKTFSIPCSWQGNDLFMVGRVESLKRFWRPFEISSLMEVPKAKWWGPTLVLYRDATVLTAEQILFRRHFEDSSIPVTRGWLDGRLEAHRSLAQVHWVDLPNCGLQPPLSVRLRGALQPFVSSASDLTRHWTARQPMFLASVTAERLLPYLHPFWIGSRLSMILKSIIELAKSAESRLHKAKIWKKMN